MWRRRRMAAALGWSGPGASWWRLEETAALQRGELLRLTRDVAEMRVFLAQVQGISYEEGAAAAIAAVQAAARITPEVDTLFHVQRMADLWDEVHHRPPDELAAG